MAGEFTHKLEPRLWFLTPLIKTVMYDIGLDEWEKNYIYVTSKHVFVSGNNCGNRPGWHSDGFLTNDINYIWTDKEPTVFSAGLFDLTLDHEISLRQMEQQAFKFQTFVYPPKTLLKLDQYVIHRSPEDCDPGYRTFIKISVSRYKYNLIGNSHNYLFDYDWDMSERTETRNHPSSNK